MLERIVFDVSIYFISAIVLTDSMICYLADLLVFLLRLRDAFEDSFHRLT